MVQPLRLRVDDQTACARRGYGRVAQTSAHAAREVRRDLLKYLRAVDKRDTLQAAERLRSFERPALVVWAAEDRVMPPEHGRRLAELLPRGRLIEIDDSYTLIPEDRPVELPRVIQDFVRDTL